MAIKINPESMSADLDGAVIATATRTGNRWTVSSRLGTLTPNQAISAMMTTEYLGAEHAEVDPFVAGLRQELPHG
jgi:hypothetical protein